jgi:hypothetical protein
MTAKRLTLDERRQIEGLINSNLPHKKICEIVGINRTTLYREFKKCKNHYDAKEAHNNTGKGYKKIDFSIIGKKFGLLTVVDYVHKHNHRTYWKCRCDCGKFTIISRKIIADYCSPDRPHSCGCIAKEHRGKKEMVPFEEACLRKYQDLISFRNKNGECWEWTGYRGQGKTPKTSWKNKSMSVRKCMYLLMHGSTYEPNPVFTTCGNLLCFNPDHITLERPEKRQLYED